MSPSPTLNTAGGALLQFEEKRAAAILAMCPPPRLCFQTLPKRTVLFFYARASAALGRKLFTELFGCQGTVDQLGQHLSSFCLTDGGRHDIQDGRRKLCLVVDGCRQIGQNLGLSCLARKFSLYSMFGQGTALGQHVGFQLFLAVHKIKPCLGKLNLSSVA